MPGTAVCSPCRPFSSLAFLAAALLPPRPQSTHPATTLALACPCAYVCVACACARDSWWWCCQQVSIYGLFTVMAFHVPFVFVGIKFMLGGIPWDSILGIVVGHLYFYLTVLYPAIGGPRLLRPPLFLRNWLADRGVGTRVNTHAATAQDSFRAFRGRGMRLGAQ